MSQRLQDFVHYTSLFQGPEDARLREMATSSNCAALNQSITQMPMATAAATRNNSLWDAAERKDCGWGVRMYDANTRCRRPRDHTGLVLASAGILDFWSSLVFRFWQSVKHNYHLSDV